MLIVLLVKVSWLLKCGILYCLLLFKFLSVMYCYFSVINDNLVFIYEESLKYFKVFCKEVIMIFIDMR